MFDLITSVSCQINSSRYFIWCQYSISFHGLTYKSSYARRKKTLRYLHGTTKLKIVYRKQEDPNLLGESDADCSDDQYDRKSTTGFHFKYSQHSGATSWQVRKQQTVALSNCEAEYQGLAAAAQEVFFHRQKLCDLQQPTSLDEDNQSAIKLSTNLVFDKRSKHIDVKQHFL